MNQGKYVFSQVISYVSHNDFNVCVERYNGDYKVIDFKCWNQFLCMAFGQLTHRESLSDTMLCLSQLNSKLYHLGIGKAVAKSTLSTANENRDWRIYADLAQILIARAKQLYGSDSNLDVDLKQNVFAIDATVIDLCLSVFPWATFRRTKAAIKLHTQLNLKNSIPEFIAITPASTNEMKILDLISFEEDSFYVMDRGYMDFLRMHRIHLAKAFFVTRAKNGLAFERVSSCPADKATGILCDQTVRLRNKVVSQRYPGTFRRIKFYDKTHDKILIFLTNNFDLKPGEIAQLYKHRWKIEIFFKWIKQHLKIKSLWGNSPNAVKTQIWIAICVYVIVAIIKRQLAIKQSLYEMLQILSITMLEKTPLNELFNETSLQNFKEQTSNQLNIFD